MKRIGQVLVLCLAFTACGRPSEQVSYSMEVKGESFPLSPHATMTPGSTCSKPSQIRYPEGISYCERAVATSLKKHIISTYDKTFGYTISSMDRQDFKIDHYIPLCMGGSNNTENLWPQHKSVYVITDPLEMELCQAMAAGKLKQAVAIATIKEAKGNLEKVSNIRDGLRVL